MKAKSAVLELNSLSAGSKRRLSQYCSRLSTSSEKDLFDDQILDTILRYCTDSSLVERVRQHCNLYGYSQSRKDYSMLLSQIEEFSKPDYPSFRWNRNYQSAKKLLMNEFRRASLKSLHYKTDQDIEEVLPKKSTHAGWSFIMTGLRSKGEYLEGILKTYLLKQTRALEQGSFNSIILPGVRTQCSNVFEEDGTFLNEEARHKTRLVSMIDIYTILAELKFSNPLQSWISTRSWYAGGKNDHTLLLDIRNRWSRNQKWISLDYSRYDQSISSWLIYDAFDIIREAFCNDGTFEEELWKIIVDDFVHKNFIDGEGRIWHSDKGVPSGSMFTQMVDSIINQLMISSYCISKGYRVSTLIMGDDNLMFTNEFQVEKDDICSYLMKNFGIRANTSKSSSGGKGQDPEFLSRFWTASGPYRCGEILISKLLFPEKFRNYKEATPELVLYSYILAYNKGIEEFIDVFKFKRETALGVSEVYEAGGKYLSGYLGYLLDYGMISLGQGQRKRRGRLEDS